MTTKRTLDTTQYPAWLYFFPMTVLICVYALLGKTGYILVADFIDPQYALPKIPPPPESDFFLYYVLTYGLLFPGVFLSQWFYFRALCKRLGLTWRDVSRLDKILIFTYGILSVASYRCVEKIFGVNAPYNHRWDLYIGKLHIWTGDILGFFVAIPLLMMGFHGINFALCRLKGDKRQLQFFIVVIGTCILGMIVQDWFWFITDPYIPFGPGTVVGVYFTTWVKVPFLPFFAPLVYIVVSLLCLFLFYLSTVNLYTFNDYVYACVCPLCILYLSGNIIAFFT